MPHFSMSPILPKTTPRLLRKGRALSSRSPPLPSPLHTRCRCVLALSCSHCWCVLYQPYLYSFKVPICWVCLASHIPFVARPSAYSH